MIELFIQLFGWTSMSPRRYSMASRTAAFAKTRQRILDATIKLHTQNGIFGTTWKDIATEADVAVGTVYKHFPTLDDLVPACGELLMERLRPPSPEAVTEIIGDATDPEERLRRVANELFAFYQRGGRHLESDLRERELPAMREWEEYLRHMVAGFVREALAHDGPGDDVVQAISFLFDFPTFNAMRIRGMTVDLAVETATTMALCRLKGRGRTSTS
ncbi:TetR/AcrR family transcriptional regulator [Mesorhizobium sp. M0815]|uniref:TetR/AcrR family transcriptional regulator n=1 Tax=Mesorhizobium sp. M0815 TaxID=2957005 RepID=UPI0033353CCA